MSALTFRRALWCVFVLTLPIPFYLGALEFAPLLRLLFLSGLVWGVVLTEGSGGFQGLFALLGAVQVLFWGGLLWGAVALLARGRGIREPSHRAIVFGSFVTVMLSFSMLEIYSTPLSSTRPQSDLFGLFE